MLLRAALADTVAALRPRGLRPPREASPLTTTTTTTTEAPTTAAPTTFRDLGVLPEIAEALENVGITTPFPIQQMTLPIALMGTDLIGQARTGTGKTLAFGIPLLQRVVAPHDRDYEQLVAPGKPQALVVTPTRELTLQVANDLVTADSIRQVRILTVYGGTPYEPQLDALAAGVEVVVGTPGRLLDLANRRALDLSHIKVLVLDEADEMLDLGFLPDVERILRLTPELRQTMLFSATMPSAVITLARTHMRHPVNVRAESPTDTQTVPATAQFVYRAHGMDKPEIVARILQAENRGLSIIFTRTKRDAQRLADDLAERGFNVAPLHGDLPQVAREKAMKRFREGKVDVLVATDVAARGIDVEAVTHVINYQCPDDEKTYLHRIGRTGRAGASGIAVTLVDWDSVARWKMINQALDLPYDDPVETYSTSAELRHDMGIPSDVTGRLVPATSAAQSTTSPRSSDRRGGSDGRGKARSGGEPEGRGGSAERTRSRNRNRTRTRAGMAVPGSEPGSTPVASSEPSTSDASVSPPRRRRRRRSGGPTTASSAD